MYLSSLDQCGNAATNLASWRHCCVCKSKSINVLMSSVEAEIYLPLGDQLAERSPFEPGTTGTCLLRTSTRLMTIACRACGSELGGKRPKIKESPSGDQLGSPSQTIPSVTWSSFPSCAEAT